MANTLKDLTVEELRKIIEESIREIMEDYMEDFFALASEKYIKSIEEARQDYRDGKVKSYEEIFGSFLQES